MNKLVAILFLIPMGWSSVSAQIIRSFSGKPEVFIEELGTYMKSSNKEEGSASYKAFREIWDEGKYTEPQTGMIISMCNDMIIDLQKPVPDFSNFLRALTYGKDSIVQEAKFDNWLKASNNFLQNNQKAFERLTVFSIDFFQSSALSISQSSRWYADATDFKFLFSDNNIQIQFEKVNLYGVAKGDSIIIRETAGSYNIDQVRWKGKGGITGWERQKLPITEMHVQLGTYEIDMQRLEYQTKNAELFFPALSSTLIQGHFSDKASQEPISKNRIDYKDAPYPMFSSIQKDLEFSAIASGKVKFRGGLSLVGEKMRATGNQNDRAVLEFYYKDKKMIEASTENFSIRDNAIRSLDAEITIFTDSGTIYHPRMSLNYLMAASTLILSRGSKGLEQAPIYDSDHLLEIYVDRIIWKMDEAKINFDMMQNDAAARFESANFFKDFRYDRIQGILGYNPLSKLQRYCIQNRSREFSLDEYTAYMRGPKSNIKIQIIQLADEGFLYFNPQTEIIRVKPKVFHYVNAHFKMTDYDVLRFNSIIAARPNAYLNLVNYNLVIEGVPVFRFSDSQTVTAHPHEQMVTVKHGRDLEFGGLVRAGRFDFGAKQFNFNYGDFSISSSNIDYMKIYFPDPQNERMLKPIKSVLRDINGTLLIDKTTNKSGLVRYPEYPIFISRSSALITYDKPEIFGGTYKKDDFRFEVDPFTIDSLDNFTIAGLKFPGTFVSAGILPEFKYEASIMEDFSLGFRKSSPPGGYPMYGGKAQGEIDVELSEKGLWASGKLNYNGAVMQSSKMALMPDSAFAETESYVIRESEQYPRMEATDVFNRWRPYGDSMMINTNGHEVSVFRDGQVFTGELVHTPAQLSGNGVLSFPGFEMASNQHVFQTNRALADTAAVKIGAVDGARISFATNNVKADVNFDTRIGDFKANIPGQFTEFPYNAFASSMDEYKWNMDQETIELNQGPRLKKEESIFISRKPEQQGLRFISTKALFDMKAGVIYAEEVPYIDVADSRVFPFDEKLTINKDADISPLENAKILASRDNRYHDLYEAGLKISGRYALSGTAKYIYKDKHETGQEIFFDQITVARDTHIVARGAVGDSTGYGFIISPKIGYRGAVELESSEEYLSFNGYVIALHRFKTYASGWIRLKDRPDPNNLIVQTGRPRNDANSYVDIGMHMSSSDSFFLYPSFFTRKPRYSDYDITTDTGIFYYDESEEAFFIGDRDRLMGDAIHGSYLSFSESEMMVESHGKLDLGLGMGELNEGNFDALTAGRVYMEDEDTISYIDMMMAISMNLPSAAYDRMAAVMSESGQGASRIAYEDLLRSSIAEFLDEKKFKKMEESWASDRELRPEGELDRSLFITSSTWQTDRQRRSLILNGPIGVGSVNGKYVGREFEAIGEVSTRRSGTKLSLYIEVTKFDWFFFEYFRGNLYVYSTDKDFNDAVMDGLKKVNKRGYTVRRASPTTVNRFIDRIDAAE